MKNWKQSNVMAIIAIVGIIMGFVACDNSGNNDPKTFTVTIGSLTNGTITANPTIGVEGTEITLTVSPGDFYRLKIGTLKYGSTAIDETTLKFSLPASDVTINAQFESLFIGKWAYTYDNVVEDDCYFLFLEDGIFGLRGMFINKWHHKGTWILNGSNTIKLTFTHLNTSSGYDTLDDFTDEDRGTYSTTDVNFTIEMLTNTTIKIMEGVLEGEIYTFVQ
jgi:hypothetical protein